MIAPAQTEKRYYVYIYAYPDGFINKDGTDLGGIVFYVGKGSLPKRYSNSFDRIYAHEVEARGGCSCPKCRVIREIWQSGMTVTKSKIAHFAESQDAYIYEWGMIHMVYASLYLTNTKDNVYERERKRKRQAAFMSRYVVVPETREEMLRYSRSPVVI